MASKTNKMDPIKEERAGKVREVGAQAIWSLSSCKPGRYEKLIKFIMYSWARIFVCADDSLLLATLKKLSREMSVLCQLCRTPQSVVMQPNLGNVLVR